MASSFRMMLFPPREAMTTAEPPAVVALSAFRIYCSQQNLSAIVGPGGEAFCLFCVICGFYFSCPFVLLSFIFLFF